MSQTIPFSSIIGGRMALTNDWKENGAFHESFIFSFIPGQLSSLLILYVLARNMKR